MLTQEQFQRLAEIKTQFESLDEERIYRASLGTASLKEKLKPKIDNAIKKIDFIFDVGEFVPEQTTESTINIFNNILGQISYISSLDNPSYVGQVGQDSVVEINRQIEEFKLYWMHFIAAGIEKKGLLDDENIEIQHQRAINELREEAEKALEKVKEETDNAVAKAQESAEQIEKNVRLTAAGISVDVAQDQFREAQQEFKNQTFMWGIFSGISIGVFILALIYFVSNSQPNEKLGFGIIYFTALRITILAAIGGVAAFCLRIFRANMHMRAHNQHRQRLANSMAAFVESASTKEQRDLILAHLVDAIASFGSSGLLTKSDDSVNPSKMTIDTINRTLTGSSD